MTKRKTIDNNPRFLEPKPTLKRIVASKREKRREMQKESRRKNR
jgi:hypothetical protein